MGAPVKIRFSQIDAFDPSIQARRDAFNEVGLLDLTLASALLSEIFVAWAEANAPFGYDLESPVVVVEGGSVSFSIGGGLFASGLGLVVATSAGLVVAPLAVPAGSILAAAGLFDLVMTWRSRAADIRTRNAEVTKLSEESRKLAAEARMLSAEAGLRAVERQLKQLELDSKQQGRFPIDSHRRPASAVIPRQIVQEGAQEWDTSEEHAHFLLNRVLPTVAAAKQAVPGLNLEVPSMVTASLTSPAKDYSHGSPAEG
jgi:hypothetical protein